MSGPSEPRRKELLKATDIVTRFSVSKSWLYDGVKKGTIPHLRLGGENGPVRFVPSEMERFLAQSRRGPVPDPRVEGTV